MITDDLIKTTFLTKSNSINPQKLKDLWLLEHPDILCYLKYRYNDSDSLKETVYRIIHNIDYKPICPICSKPILFKRSFTECCCKKCAAIYSIEKRLQTCLKKYGVDYFFLSLNFKDICVSKFGAENPALSKEVLEKIKTTNLEHWGYETYSKTEEWRNAYKEACLEKFGVENPMFNANVIYERKKKCLEEYGVENPALRQEVKDKISISYKATCLKIYGLNNIWQLPLIKDFIVKNRYDQTGFAYPLLDPSIKSQVISTNNEKYGVDWICLMIENIEKSHSKESMQKRYETHKKNNSFNTSKIEKLFEEYLSKCFPDDYITQYRSEVYPFNCDFYIKSLDLYIELLGSWTHGFHPYDKDSIEDNLKLLLWESKNSNYYKNAINTWTVRDVKKRCVAKLNNLHYIELFSADLDKCVNLMNEYIIKMSGLAKIRN